MKYSFTQNLVEAAAGAGSQQIWNLNSLFDPDASGVGHQPLYYDQLFSNTGPYQRYTVHDVRIEVSITNLNTGTAAVAGLYEQVGAIDLPGRDAFLEKPTVQQVILPFANGGAAQRKIVRNFKIDKIIGVSRTKLMADDQYSGFWNSSPPIICYGIFMVYGMPPSPTVASVSVMTTLTFRATAFGLCAIGSS